MVLTHGIVCSSNPQRPRDGIRCGGKMLWFVKTQTTEEKEMTVNNATTTVMNNTIKSESGNKLKDPIQLYPNPASNYVEISYSSKIDGEFVLYNTIGDVILKASLPKEYIKRKIQLNDIASGLYHYEIYFLDGEKQFGKLSILK